MVGPDKKAGRIVMGEVIAGHVDLAVVEVEDAGERKPGLGWTLSEEAADKLRDIDANIRAAEQLSGRLLLG